LQDFVGGEFERRAVGDGVDFCAGDFAPVAIHGEGGFDDDDIRAGVDEGVKEEAQGVVAAVGEEELVGFYFEVAG
jgi:hypothetical protein